MVTRAFSLKGLSVFSSLLPADSQRQGRSVLRGLAGKNEYFPYSRKKGGRSSTGSAELCRPGEKKVRYLQTATDWSETEKWR
jgi:hypothetical protein